MIFSSPLFLFLFLPVTLAGFTLLRGRARQAFLLAASFLFYGWGEGCSLAVLPASILTNFLLGHLVARYRSSPRGPFVVWSAVAVNVGVLGWYKYGAHLPDGLNRVLYGLGITPPAFQGPCLPLGISYFTLAAISYVVDVYREETVPERSLPRFAVFLSLFPKLAAGPIARYGAVAGDLSCGRVPLGDFADGVRRFVLGLGKKVLIADGIAATTAQILAIPRADLTAGLAWGGLVCFTLQLYCDFSGYSDMAIGIGKMLGFKLPENFQHPYTSRSLTEFWRRWHMSLSAWLRDYLFIPLSYALLTASVRRKIAEGRYRTNYRAGLSIFLVFTLCGIWHGPGAGFLAWGMLNGVVLAVESLWLGRRIAGWKPPLQHLYLMTVVMLAWVPFMIPSLESAFQYYGALSGLASGSGTEHHLRLYVTPGLLLALAAGILASMPTVGRVAKLFEAPPLRRFAPAAEGVFLVVVLVCSFASLAGSTFTPFIYQGF
jgi:alginate O-acetyltransferase complex protein AlgI